MKRMERILCLLLAAVMLLPLWTAAAAVETAGEIGCVFADNKTELDAAALRDNTNDTGYTFQRNKQHVLKTELAAGETISSLYIKLSAAPDKLNVSAYNEKSKKWEALTNLENPGPEMVLRYPQGITGQFRIVLNYNKGAAPTVYELRCFTDGVLPQDIHAWQNPGEATADILFMAERETDLDMAQITQWTEAGHSVAVALLIPSADPAVLYDTLWEGGVRMKPISGNLQDKTGNAAFLKKAWGEKQLVKLMTSWIRQVKPIMAAAEGEVLSSLVDTAVGNAPNYAYEQEAAAADGLWIPSVTVKSAAEVADAAAGMPERSYDALRQYCGDAFSAAVCSDPSDIPYPDNRLPDGYLPEGEFVYENKDKGLWAYLSPTVQVEIVQYTRRDPIASFFISEVKFKPDQESFGQVLFNKAAFKNQQTYPETLAQNANLVFGINGDYYPYRIDHKTTVGNILRDRTVLYDWKKGGTTPYPVLDTMALHDDGSISVYKVGEVTATELLAQGDIHDALSFGPLLIRDGQLQVYWSKNGSATATEQRCSIGMIEPGHYIVATVEGKIPKGPAGLTINDAAMLLYSRGVMQGFNLDGGSTTVLVFMGDKLNRTGKGTFVGESRNMHELFGVGYSEQTHTDMLNGK